MNAQEQRISENPRESAWAGRTGVCLLLMVIYAVGLSHDLAEPWTGLHDWNGAFFSQLARNHLRYPTSMHHGMPVVAVGEAVPPPEERSIYATHPPGLVWLVALAFRMLGGQAEWMARMVPLLFSLGTLALLVRLADRAWGRETALTAGVIYGVMPMAVYFGRMVDHEAVCLFLMIAAVSAWPGAGVPARHDGHGGPPHDGWRWSSRALWAASVSAAIWVDWSGVLFAGLFAVWVGVGYARRRIARSRLVTVVAITLAAGGTMLVHLVYAGLSGRWSDLVAIFLSRSAEAAGEVRLKDGSAPGGAWEYTVDNLTWPLLVLSVVGLALCMAGLVRRARGRSRSPVAQASRLGTPVAQASRLCPPVAQASRLCPHRRDGGATRLSGHSPSAREPRQFNAGPTSTGGAFWLVPVTGLLWLLVFWRQYERHNYWAFYLGPAVALLSSFALIQMRDWVRARGVRWANGVLFVGLGVVVGFGLRGTADYFSRVSYPPDEVAAWQEAHRRTNRADRVLLFRNPIREELRGGYKFRNLVPPQQAFYLDRAFGVEGDLDAVARRASRHAVFIIPVGDALLHESALEGLRTRYPQGRAVSKLLFDLAAPWPEGGLRPPRPLR